MSRRSGCVSPSQRVAPLLLLRGLASFSDAIAGVSFHIRIIIPCAIQSIPSPSPPRCKQSPSLLRRPSSTHRVSFLPRRHYGVSRSLTPFSFHFQLSIALARFSELDLLVTLQLLQKPTNALFTTLLCIWGIEPTHQFLQTLQMAVEANEEESLSFRAFLSVRIARILLGQIACSLPPQEDSPFERTVRFIMYKQLQRSRKRFLEWVVSFHCS